MQTRQVAVRMQSCSNTEFCGDDVDAALYTSLQTELGVDELANSWKRNDHLEAVQRDRQISYGTQTKAAEGPPSLCSVCQHSVTLVDGCVVSCSTVNWRESQVSGLNIIFGSTFLLESRSRGGPHHRQDGPIHVLNGTGAAFSTIEYLCHITTSIRKRLTGHGLCRLRPWQPVSRDPPGAALHSF
ncbi:hypothetical protein BD310DRAFT_548532 [Dichomitus squalens]|uniref:Uncharacterized protein n=1 Tax=Dichomitus squalens TaxID=114155 RepID=A0A4V2K7U8_9APHY|nr:hypothetical protein BD310DRAFT_548532 [Dichomitus squalens]